MRLGDNFLHYTGLYPTVGLRFAVAFGSLSAMGQLIAYTRGVRPSMDYVANRRPRFTPQQFSATVMRAIGSVAAALVCSSFVHHVDHPVLLAVRVGFVTGLVTAIGTLVNPYIEYYADNLPQRYLGAFGILLILCGFCLQSLEYWIALFRVDPT